MRGLRLGTEWWHARELCLHHGFHFGFVEIELSFVTAELQMHGSRHAGCRSADGLPHHVRYASNVINRDVHLRHRLKGRDVIDFLIDLTKLRFRISPARHRNHRRMGQICVAQACGEIECADHLGHANSRFAGRPRIAVCHVSCGFLTVTMHARDVCPPLHLGKVRRRTTGTINTWVTP